MPTVQFHTPDGEKLVLDGRTGSSLMEIAQQEGVCGIVAECGGAGACATCHVYVDPEQFDLVGEPGELEDDMLDEAYAERRPNSRLSCQIEWHDGLDGLRVEVAPEES